MPNEPRLHSVMMKSLLVGAFSFLIAGPVRADTDQQARDPEPLETEHGWIRPDDYPPASRYNHITGVTDFALQVNEQGIPTDCAITRSSGTAELDAKTCELVLARARFDPARDGGGRKVAGVYSNRVRWTLGGVVTLVPEQIFVTTEAIVGPDGLAKECTVKFNNVNDSSPDNPCLSMEGKRILPPEPNRPRLRYRVKQFIEFEAIP